MIDFLLSALILIAAFAIIFLVSDDLIDLYHRADKGEQQALGTVYTAFVIHIGYWTWIIIQKIYS